MTLKIKNSKTMKSRKERHFRKTEIVQARLLLEYFYDNICDNVDDNFWDVSSNYEYDAKYKTYGFIVEFWLNRKNLLPQTTIDRYEERFLPRNEMQKFVVLFRLKRDLKFEEFPTHTQMVDYDHVRFIGHIKDVCTNKKSEFNVCHDRFNSEIREHFLRMQNQLRIEVEQAKANVDKQSLADKTPDLAND